jgi:hypothetical protein
MRLLRGKVEQRRLRVPVGIGAFDARSTSAVPNLNFQKFTALIDTGAQRTCVTQNVVDQLKLKRRGRIELGNVHSKALHWTYLFNVAIWPETDSSFPQMPFGLADEIEGADLGDNRYFDVLLGMDIIQLGSLKLEFDGTFELAFP